MTASARILAYAWNHDGLGHVTRLLNVIHGVRELRPEARAWVCGEQDSDVLRRAGHPYVIVPTHRNSYAGAVSGSVPDERPFEEKVASAASAAAVDAARPTVVLHDSVVSADLMRAAPSAGTPHVLVIRRRRRMHEYLDSMGSGLDDLRLLLLPHEPDEVPLDQIPKRVHSRLAFTGPIVAPVVPAADGSLARYAIPPGHRVVVVTGGGGGFDDQHAFLDAAADAIAGGATEPTVAIVLLGYFFDGVVSIAALAERRPGLVSWRVARHEWNLPGLMSMADVVIAQGGYNTLFEARAVGVPVVSVPGTRPGDDQLQRARSLARADASVRVVEEPAPDAIADAIRALVARPHEPMPTQEADRGRKRAAQAVLSVSDGGARGQCRLA